MSRSGRATRAGDLLALARRSPPAFALNQRRVRLEARRGAPRWALRAARGPRDRAIALSYDDGPSPANTPELLEILASAGARATFFVLGSEVDAHPELAARIVAAGHELGNHSFTHVHARRLDASGLRGELERASGAIAAVAPPTRLFRPPFGKLPRRGARVCEELGLTTVLWSVDSGDTMRFSAARIAREVVARVEPGDIVLMHDGGDRRPRTLEATRVVLEQLARRGYSFVTVSELLAGAT